MANIKFGLPLVDCPDGFGSCWSGGGYYGGNPRVGNWYFEIGGNPYFFGGYQNQNNVVGNGTGNTPPPPTPEMECQNLNLTAKGITFFWDEQTQTCKQKNLAGNVVNTDVFNIKTPATINDVVAGTNNINIKPLAIAALIGVGLYVALK